jgi:hypothetical protein
VLDLANDPESALAFVVFMVLIVFATIVCFDTGRNDNQYCENRFQFRPFSIATVAASPLPFTLVLAVALALGPQSIVVYFALAIALSIIAILYLYIASKTKPAVALMMTGHLLGTGLFIFMALVIVVMDLSVLGVLRFDHLADW